MTRNQRYRPASAARRGMTLIEVVVSLIILAGAVLGMGVFIARFSRTVTEATIHTTADQLAADRLEEVKAATRYSAIDTLFAGKVETNPQGQVGFTRRTLVKRVGGAPADVDDYRIITVVVTTPAMKTPATKTTIISVF